MSGHRLAVQRKYQELNVSLTHSCPDVLSLVFPLQQRILGTYISQKSGP